MPVILQIAALTAALFIAQEVLRHVGKWALLGLFLGVPLVLTPYWRVVNDFDVFVWIKIYTMMFSVGWGVLLRFTPLGQHRWAGNTIALLFAANILEATAVDAGTWGLAHTLNAVAGLLLVVTLPFGSQTLQIDETRRSRDLLFGVSRGWLIGYTLWNWTFVYLNYPAFVGHHTAVLLSALIVGLMNPRLWTQARGCTLALNLLVMATINHDMITWLDTSIWFNDRLALGAAGVALAGVAGSVIRLKGEFLPSPWLCGESAG